MITGKRLMILAVASAAWALWAGALTSLLGTPDVAHLRWMRPHRTSFMERAPGPIDYRWMPLSRISPLLKQAVVIAEDDQFFEHRGADWQAMKAAAGVDWRRRKFVRGASTITMQLARNLYLTPRKSLLRKLKEVMIALKIERELPKERILELYLNVAEWGEGIYGAEAASRHYFNKGAGALTPREAALLAAILPRPRWYDRHRGGAFINRRAAEIEGRL